jgi:RHS repeat-associated protein
MWQEDGRGVVSRVYFGYDPSNRVSAIRPPGNSITQEERIEYDLVRGNVSRTTTPLGYWTTYASDAIGLDTLVNSPIDGDPASSVRLKNRSAYDLMGRTVNQWIDAPAMTRNFDDIGGQAAEMPQLTRKVSTTYDAEGNPTQVVRRSEDGLGGLVHGGTSVTTTIAYDKAMRKTSENTGSRQLIWTYDIAGNVLTQGSNLGVVTMTYDALNRLATRSVPVRKLPRTIINSAFPGGLLPGQEVYYPFFRRPLGGGGFLDTLVIFADSSTFSYDESGNLTLAENNDARIWRSYFRNGLLRTDTTQIARYTFVASPAAPVFNGVKYSQGYKYDLSGRRIERTDNNLYCATCSQLYQYDSPSGLLDWTEDRGTSSGTPVRVSFQYDGAGRVVGRYTNGFGDNAKVAVTHAFDPDGQRIARDVTSTTTTATTVYSDDHEYDGRGKKVKTNSISGLTDIASDYWNAIFDGIGTLTGVGRKRNGNPTTDVNKVDALGNVLHRVSDSTISPHYRRVVHDVVGDLIRTIHRPAYVVDDGDPTATIFNTDFGDSDINGNQVQEDHVVHQVQVNPPSGQIANFNVIPTAGHYFSRMTYGIDNKLRYAQRTSYDPSGKNTLFTEYRYDALGRRVLMRSRRSTPCMESAYKCQSTMDRFVWDGDQLIAESRGNGADTQSETALNQDGGTGLLQGWVRYTHAGGIDEPLAVWRSEVNGIVPHFSWRGNVEAGSDITTGALLEGGSTPWIWPTRYKDINLAPETRGGTIPDPTRWLGSLVENQIDFNGLAYRRNRYYNPTSGRFTSEDPIGLAGGLNLYGFADGDPVNFSDPFGLCRLRSGALRLMNLFDGACASRDEAATKALREVGTGGKWEYAGEIVADRQGGFRYSKPRTSRSQTTAPVRPTRQNYEGLYHSHVAAPGYLVEEFSPTNDKRLGDDHGKPVYLLTPSGLIKRYDPDPAKQRQGNVSVIGRVP